MQPVPQMIASRYRVVRELGRGGMGVVYLVEHTRTGDHLALKLLLGSAAMDPQSLERFKREARASARIKSDHVVKVVDADVAPELDGAPFLVMELLDGSDLEKLLEKRGRLPPGEVVQLLSQAARGLDKAHAAGIVHRDLKPENLFLHHREDGSSIVKIVDFGIAKSLAGDTGAGDIAGAKMTQTGAVMGTPLYMAPEQARGLVGQLGPATDVWAMGLIALHLMTGEIYWRAETLAELIVQIVVDPQYPPSSRWSFLPPGFDAWFLRSCAREPAQRFARIGEQIEALAALFRESGAALVPASSPSVDRGSRPSFESGAQPKLVPSSEPAVAKFPIGASTTTSPVLSHAQGAALPGARAKPRSSAPVIAVGVVGFLLVVSGVGFGGYTLRQRAATSSTASSSTAPAVTPTLTPSEPAPAVSANATPNSSRTVHVIIAAPAGAIGEADGATVEVVGGGIELRGPVGSVHHVRLSAGGRATKADVTIAETGPVPAKIELADARAAGPTPRSSGARATPVATAAQAATSTPTSTSSSGVYRPSAL